MKFHVTTFGCQMNAGDSAWLTRALAARGHEPVLGSYAQAVAEGARVFILNTCSVREKPEQKVATEIGKLAHLARRHPELFVAVAGCVAQQLGESLFARFPCVRVVLGTDGLTRGVAAIEAVLEGREERVALLEMSKKLDIRPTHLPPAPEAFQNELTDERPESRILDSADPEAASRSLPGVPQGSAFVTIMQGCDNFCAYCIVPYVRGRQRSRAPEAVLAECRELLATGVREITLLGQNVNSYGLDASQDKVGGETPFHELVRQVAALPGLARLRFTTSHPKDLAPELIALYAELPTLCPSLHLPMQSGSDRVLKAMGRKYDRARYMDLMRQLRQVRPDIVLTTDLIVGFPGETEAEFAETLSAMEEAGFGASYSFIYSDRPGTRAERLEGKLTHEEKVERLVRLQALQEELTRKDLAEMQGRALKVMVEQVDAAEGSTSARGRDPHGRTVIVRQQAGMARPEVGEILAATVTEPRRHYLMAQRQGEAPARPGATDPREDTPCPVSK